MEQQTGQFRRYREGVMGVHRQRRQSAIQATACVQFMFAKTSSPLVFMVALWNRADHYIFALWLLLSFFLFFLA